ncbi:hypothetical protein VFPPC_16677 [Pochonia chlamydosporia 170]|uniref:Uncharacterized protein n=1 Tax=Pochonia chlamydosporia 170 TaxID=1380566 RepID=A0A179F6A2_METCM|nr:hypothetical protein VFPPC_16677 [Pochonia chlamydosporia 170]OAQ60922.1 hypothetical protein VFPPC_16677 [Pochonia chlamydosporia 170]
MVELWSNYGRTMVELWSNYGRTMTSPQEHSIPTQVAYGDNSASDNHSPGGSGQIIPSYMSPEAVRARNIILSCNPPAKQNRYTAWDQLLTHQKAHIDDLHPPKTTETGGSVL